MNTRYLHSFKFMKNIEASGNKWLKYRDEIFNLKNITRIRCEDTAIYCDDLLIDHFSYGQANDKMKAIVGFLNSANTYMDLDFH